MTAPAVKTVSLSYTDHVPDHSCLWDPTHIEIPARVEVMLARLKDTGLVDRCKKLPLKDATVEDLCAVHSVDYVNDVASTKSMGDLDELEKFSSKYEDIFVTANTYDRALTSAGCAIQAMEAVLRKESQSSFALIRPPGHHSSFDQGCGFCIFNNVAICAKLAVEKHKLSKVLIMDWDVHAGQGTQYCIADDPRIKLISIHRHEKGTFWPYLHESAAVYPDREKYSNTVNIPLSELGCDDTDYLAIMNSVVIPTIKAWGPELILVSCGYDAAFGDPEGQMRITPFGYAAMTQLLVETEIPLCLLLEGGYFIDILGYCAEYTVRGLLGEKFGQSPTRPKDSVLIAIFHALEQLEKEFVSLDIPAEARKWLDAVKSQAAEVDHFIPGCREKSVTIPHQTRGLFVYPTRTEEVVDNLRKELSDIMKRGRDG